MCVRLLSRLCGPVEPVGRGAQRGPGGPDFYHTTPPPDRVLGVPSANTMRVGGGWGRMS